MGAPPARTQWRGPRAGSAPSLLLLQVGTQPLLHREVRGAWEAQQALPGPHPVNAQLCRGRLEVPLGGTWCPDPRARGPECMRVCPCHPAHSGLWLLGPLLPQARTEPPTWQLTCAGLGALPGVGTQARGEVTSDRQSLSRMASLGQQPTQRAWEGATGLCAPRAAWRGGKGAERTSGPTTLAVGAIQPGQRAPGRLRGGPWLGGADG